MDEVRQLETELKRAREAEPNEKRDVQEGFRLALRTGLDQYNEDEIIDLSLGQTIKTESKEPESKTEKDRKKERLHTLTFHDDEDSQRISVIQKGFVDEEDTAQALLNEIRGLYESPAGIARLREYIASIVHIMIEKKMISATELLKELNKEKIGPEE